MSDELGDALAKKLGKFNAEVGGSIGYGSNKADSPSSDTQRNDTGTALQAYALLRNQLLGLEGGYLRLPSMKARASMGDYPAYKLASQGITVTYPQTAEATQRINATAPYAALNLYGPKLMGVEPYVKGGLARVRADNHEQAIYNGTDLNDYRDIYKKNAKLYGLGMNMPIDKDWNLRAEYLRIPHAIDEYHTGDRTINMGLLGLGRTF